MMLDNELTKALMSLPRLTKIELTFEELQEIRWVLSEHHISGYHPATKTAMDKINRALNELNAIGDLKYHHG